MGRIAKSRISLILLVMVCLFAFTGCSKTLEPETEEALGEKGLASFSDIDEYVQQQIMAGDIPGLAVVIVQGDKVVYLEGFGVTSVKTPSPVSPQTVFDLASSSKSFTALAVLLLRDEGLVDLDAPVQRYLPDFQLADPEASAQITVRQLLNQTGGLPGTFSEPLLYHDGSDAFDKMVAALGRVRLNQSPGSSFEYANMNYSLLGALVEKVSGIPFEDFVQQRIFTPLGMAHTTLYPSQAREFERADGHQPMFGQIVARDIPIFRSAVPVGWVMSSAEDMGEWLIAQLNEGRTASGQVIAASDIEEMHTPGVLFTRNGEEVGYGMGWFVGHNAGELAIWHGGDTPNFMSDMILLPEYKLGVVVLANTQTSTIGHSIGPGVASLILGLKLESSVVPWWAHWRAIDSIATGGVVLVLLLVLAWLAYIWRGWRQFRAKKRHFIGSSLASRMLPVWQMVLYISPLVLLVMITVAGFVVVQSLFGYNFYEVLIKFRMAAPPGVWLSGVMLVSIISLWAITLAALALVTRGSKSEAL